MDRRKKQVYRMLDANANRAVEGLRVVEDVLRFCCDDEALFRRVRDLRHETRATATKLPGGAAALLAGRDSASDVGSAIKPRNKKDTAEILRSNLQRAQEALRVLEETSASLSASCSQTFAKIRFKTYTLEKEITSATGAIEMKKKKFPTAPFIHILGSAGDFAERRNTYLKAVIRGGAGIIQLREKGMGDLDILKQAQKIGKAMQNYDTLFFLNDRVDLALAAGADGVHLGDSDLPVSTARRIADNLLVGTSTHSFGQALQAAADGPDYISLGPIFRSPTKPGRRPVGLKTLEKVCCNLHIPVVAIGGINSKNAKRVFEAGASGAAMISSARKSKDPAAYVEKILKAASK